MIVLNLREGKKRGSSDSSGVNAGVAYFLVCLGLYVVLELMGITRIGR